MIEAGFFVTAVLLAAYLLAPVFRATRIAEADPRDALEAAHIPRQMPGSGAGQ